MNIQKLKAKMVELNYSVVDLAEEIGIGSATLYAKLNGRSEFTYSELMNIKKALKMDRAEFEAILGVD